MVTKDFYSVLGVPKGSSQKEVRQAYRKLARQYHPDVNSGDKAAEARFKEVNAAYEVLSDPEKRKKYDLYGDQWEHADQIEQMRRQAGARTYRSGGDGGIQFEYGGDTGDLGSLFGNLFGRARRPSRPQAIEQRVEVSLEEALLGTTRTLQLAAQEVCATCGGSGEVAGATCHVCQGSGVTMTTRRIEVKIPPGVDSGSRVRVAGEGGSGANGATADLYLIVSVRPHATFERKGSDLYTDVDVPLTVAVLGGEVEVPALTGKVALKVPPLSQNGKQFRLAGLGMPLLGKKERGNLYARLRVRMPEELDDKERKLFEELRELERPQTADAKAGSS
jgi:DnaJ-class molecular chaperone